MTLKNLMMKLVEAMQRREESEKAGREIYSEALKNRREFYIEGRNLNVREVEALESIASSLLIIKDMQL